MDDDVKQQIDALWAAIAKLSGVATPQDHPDHPEHKAPQPEENPT